MSNAQIPHGFTAVDERTPATDKPVLAVRRSGYQGAEFEVLTARHDVAHRPREPWITLAGDAVSESGGDVLGWREADDWLL